MALTEVSGIYLRNRFRIIGSGLNDPRGFVYDYNRLPFNDADNGTAVQTGSYWDGENGAATDQYNINIISGVLDFRFTRASQSRGQEWLQAGIGDNQDLRLSGIDFNEGAWEPVIRPGVWFDLDESNYLYSNDAIELVLSGLEADKITVLDTAAEPYTPITLASYYVDTWGRARKYENFKFKHSFTSTDENEETLIGTSGTTPTLYEPRVSGIRWSYVNSGLNEFIYDPEAPAVARSANIITTVQTSIQKAPWSRTAFQLPLVPVIDIENGIDGIEYIVQADLVNVSGNIAQLNVPVPSGYNFNYFYYGSGEYVRTTENFYTAFGTWLTVASGAVADWPSTGFFVMDAGPGDVTRYVYSNKSASGLYVTFNDESEYNDVKPAGSRIWQTYGLSFVPVSGLAVAPITSGQLTAFYSISGGMEYTLNKKTGLLDVPNVANSRQVIAAFNYTRGLVLTYEPSGTLDYYKPSGVDVNLLKAGTNHGLLWASMYPLRPQRITLSTSRGTNSDGIVGPIYAGNDYLVITAKVWSAQNTPVPNVPVNLTFDTTTNVGLIDGLIPSIDNTTKVTDGAGEAKFTYTPPDTINGLGFFAPVANILNGSGLILNEATELEDFYTSGWKTLLYAMYDNDYYLEQVDTSAYIDNGMDKRFELVTQVSGQDSLGRNIWQPLEPLHAIDTNGNILNSGTALSSGVYALVYPSGSIPTDADISSYFASADKKIRIGAAVDEGFAVAPSFTTQVSIPPFMTGEFLWGPIDDQDTKAFDSLSYLTINPYTEIDPGTDRTDPRTLGNIFRIISTNTDTAFRNKFYIGVDDGLLASTPEGRRTLKRLYTFRNRFIVEVE